MATAVLDMLQFGCASCAYTIEKLGRKVSGVHEVRVDLGTREIRVDYDGERTSLEAICALVDRIGHDAAIRESSSAAAPDPDPSGRPPRPCVHSQE
jgi:copper chaperone CopZ